MVSKTKRKKRLKLWEIFVLVALISIAMTSVAYWLVNRQAAYDSKVFDMDVYIENRAGFNVDTDAIHFGVVPPNATSERKIILHVADFRTNVVIGVSGDLAGWVVVSDNNFIMEPNESRTITVSLFVPGDAKVPDFKRGRLQVLFIRA